MLIDKGKIIEESLLVLRCQGESKLLCLIVGVQLHKGGGQEFFRFIFRHHGLSINLLRSYVKEGAEL